MNEKRSERNLRIYNELMEAFNRGGVEEIIDYFAEEVEVYHPDLPEPKYEGHEGMRGMLRQMLNGNEVIAYWRVYLDQNEALGDAGLAPSEAV